MATELTVADRTILRHNCNELRRRGEEYAPSAWLRLDRMIALLDAADERDRLDKTANWLRNEMQTATTKLGRRFEDDEWEVNIFRAAVNTATDKLVAQAATIEEITADRDKWKDKYDRLLDGH